MLFKFKQKPIVLDAFTTSELAHDFHPITPAIKKLPDWYKKLPLGGNDDRFPPNMKGCPGFVNLYKQGFIIPFASDTFFHVENPRNPDELAYCRENFPHIDPPRMAFGSNACTVSPRNPDGRETILMHTVPERMGWARDYENFKVCPPWSLRCKEYVKFLFLQPGFSNMESPEWFSPSGVIDYKYNWVVNVHFMINLKAANNVFFAAGSPMLHLIPLTERPVELKTHFVTPEELRRSVKTYSNFGRLRRGYIKGVKKLEGRF